MYEVSVDKTQPQLLDLIESVVNGEEVIFTKNYRPVAKLTAMRKGKPQPTFGSAKGPFELADDFDEPIADLDEYRK